MKNALKKVSVFIILLAMLSVYSFIVRHVALGGEKTGRITKPLEYFSTFPKTVYNVINSHEIKGLPLTYLKKDTSFYEINKLTYNLYGINSFYIPEKNKWSIRLINFKNDSVVHVWDLFKDDNFREDERKFEYARPMHALLLPDRQIVVNCIYTKNLYKFDKNSHIKWHNTDKVFHHSLNLDSDSNIWACTSDMREFKLDKTAAKGYYRDDFITRINAETGSIMYDKSISEIFLENGYSNFVYGFSNNTTPDSSIDPLRLNDVQPVLEDGKFWKKGDVFFSLRHKSLIVHYRPGTNKIIRLIYGPFLFQHDVDIYSDNEIALFNNNFTTVGNFNFKDKAVAKAVSNSDELLSSEILIYNYEDSTFNSILKKHFNKEKIYTKSEGLYEVLSTGDVYVENHNEGELYIMNEDEIIFKKQFATARNNLVHMPTWIRIYENVEF